MFTRLKTRWQKKSFKSSTEAQIFDLLQLSRKERECRSQCRKALSAFTIWKKAARNQKHKIDHIIQAYAGYEGMILRRQAEDTLILYRLIRKNRIRMFDDYMSRLPMRSHVFRAAS